MGGPRDPALVVSVCGRVVVAARSALELGEGLVAAGDERLAREGGVCDCGAGEEGGGAGEREREAARMPPEVHSLTATVAPAARRALARGAPTRPRDQPCGGAFACDDAGGDGGTGKVAR